MAKTCSVCGTPIGFMSGNRGMCQDCFLKSLSGDSAETTEAVAQRKNDAESRSNAISQVLLTTETVSDLKIIERIEIVTAEVAFGMNIFKDLFAGVRDIVGGRSAAVQKTLRDARRTALHELKTEAYDVGANAVVGVDLDYVELSGNGNMVMLVASGTAVVIEK